LLFNEFVNSQGYFNLKKTFNGFKIFLITKDLDFEKNDLLFKKGIETYSNLSFLEDFYSQSWCSLVLDNKKIGSHIKVIEAAYYSTIVIGLNGVERGFENLFLKSNLNKNLSNNIDELFPIITLLFNNKALVAKESIQIKKVQLEDYNFINFVKDFNLK
jgi:hypothetical protein